MLARVILSVFLVFALAGCAASSQQPSVQSPPVVQESHFQDYDYDDTLSSESDETPVKRTYSEPAIQLKLSRKQIQRALNNAGYYQGSIDGKIGPKTKAAIIKFQRANGLKADGIVGKRTSAELNKGNL